MGDAVDTRSCIQCLGYIYAFRDDLNVWAVEDNNKWQIVYLPL